MAQMQELLFINKNDSVYLWCKVVYNHLNLYKKSKSSLIVILAGSDTDLSKTIKLSVGRPPPPILLKNLLLMIVLFWDKDSFNL